VSLIFEYFWVAFILTTAANAAIWWSRGKPYRERDASLTEGYRSLVRGFLFWGNVPWFVMGLGILVGSVPTIFHYFNPKSLNPFVLGWFGSIFVLWVLGTHWLFFRGGAEQLIRHPGLIQPQPKSPSAIKNLWLLGLAGGIFAIFMMSTMEFTPPEF
jgi:hypothetical protein